MGWVGGWVFFCDVALADSVCVTSFWKFGLLEKQIFGLHFSDVNFSDFGSCSCDKVSDFSLHNVSVKLLDFRLLNRWHSQHWQ